MSRLANILEDRVLSYIQANAVDGHLRIKLDDLSNALAETRNPIIRALNSLEKKKKIRKQSRSKMGLEIDLINKINSNAATNKDIISQDPSNEAEETTFYEVTSNLQNLNLEQLRIVQRLVKLHIMEKEGKDTNE